MLTMLIVDDEKLSRVYLKMLIRGLNEKSETGITLRMKYLSRRFSLNKSALQLF